jgi:hypothetical protein
MVVLTRSVERDMFVRCSVALDRLSVIGLTCGHNRYHVRMLPRFELDIVVWFLSFVLLSCWESRSPSGPYIEEETEVLRELLDIEYMLEYEQLFPPLVRELLWMFRSGGKSFAGFGEMDREMDMEDPMDVLLMFGYWLVDGENIVYRVGRDIVTGQEHYEVPPPQPMTPQSSDAEDDSTAEVYPSSLDDEGDWDEAYEPPTVEEEYSIPDFDSDGNIVYSDSENDENVDPGF